MKPPATASEVELMRNGNGVYERYIGKTATGKKRWRFGKDEATAKVEAWETWNRWENRPEGCETWEELENGETHQQRVATAMQKLSNEGAKRIAVIKAAMYPAANAKPIMTAKGVRLSEAKRVYLESQKKRVGLIGSLGITQAWYDMIKYRLDRACEFIKVDLMDQLDYDQLQTAIYAMAACPPKKPNPLASDKVKAEQKSEAISQDTALAFINSLKAFLNFCCEDDAINYVMPRHGKKLFQIRPEPTEQVIKEVSAEQLKTLWDGCVNGKARTKDKGKRRRLFLLLGLNCGFGYSDLESLTNDHIKKEGGKVYIWKLRKKTRKTNRKLVKTKWLIWKETAELLAEYVPLNLTRQNIRSSWVRLKQSSKVNIPHKRLRKTGAMFMEKIGQQDLADTYLAHARHGQTDSYSHPHWETLSKALEKMYAEFIKPAIGG